MIDPPKKTGLSSASEADGTHSPPFSPTKTESACETACDYSSKNSSNYEDFLRESRRLADPYYLSTISMCDLYQNTYQNKPPIIDGLLYNGVYILAGPPKIGKSFLVAQISYHVSLGKKLWNFDVQKGTVLYLALEDDFQRLQSRMFRMYGVEDSANLYFATAASQIGFGLDEQLEFFLQEHWETKLIVIDTFQKIRDTGGKAYSYANDYEIVGKLKQFADKHGVCVLLVHHTRKQPAGDAFEMISGTTGLLGCADGALLIQKKKRTDLEATVNVVGRDQQDQILYLRKDPINQLWFLDRTETELFKEPPDPILNAVADLVTKEQPKWTGSPTDLVAVLKVEMLPNALTKHLNVMCGKLKNEYNIEYENKAKHIGRVVTLTLLPFDATK